MKHVSDQGNQHNNGSHQDQICDNQQSKLVQTRYGERIFMFIVYSYTPFKFDYINRMLKFKVELRQVC